MRAYRIAEPQGTPELTDIPVPTPAAGEVLVRITACGLNFADLLMIKGTYQSMPEAPFTLGMEVAGVVEALGEGVSHPAVGTRIVVFNGSGGLAEYGCFPAMLCLPIPNDMPDTDAAAFVVAYGTSHLALSHRAKLQSGETLLVTGAAGGVGLTAVEIGKLMGARVIAAARGQDKLEVAQQAGADHLIDTQTDDLRQVVKDLGGADVIYDPVGGDLFNAALRASRPEARLISIGFASGDVPQIPANILLVKNLTAIGFFWGGYMQFAPQHILQSLGTLFDWYSQGKIKPHISHAVPLPQVEEALDLLRSRKSTGKVVVTMG